MKSSILFIATLAISSLCLTSCEKDSFTENIRLDASNQIINKEITTRSLGESFEFDEMVMLTAEDAFRESDIKGFRRPVAIEGDIEKHVKMPSGLAINGFGDSHILNWGSWYVDVNLVYQRTKNTVSGIIKFTFPDYGDEVEFAVNGQPALVTNPDDKSQELELHLTVLQGTGRYEDKTFEGSAVLLDVAGLMEREEDFSTHLVVNGTIEDNP